MIHNCPQICTMTKILQNFCAKNYYNIANNVHNVSHSRVFHMPCTRTIIKFNNQKGYTAIKSCINYQRQSYVSRCKDDSKAVNSNTGSSVECGSKPGKWPTGNRAHFEFHPDTEAILNEQLSAELKAFYYYLSMAAYFGRVDVALPGCESFFMQMHHEEHEHALMFFNYINMRGGSVNLCPVYAPENQDWKCPLNAFKTALQLEIEVTEKLVAVNCVAEKHRDLNASDFIVTGFMEGQMKSVNEMARLVTVLSGIGDQALARFMFDKDLLEHYVMPEFNIMQNKDRKPSKNNSRKKK